MTLREKAYRGFKWTTAGGIVTSGLDFAKFAILARLLVPEDFGLMAMIIVVLGFATAYADGGTGNAVIHRQDTTSNQLSSLFWLNLMAGLCLYVVIIASSPLIASLYDESRLPELLAWAGLVVLITAIGSLYQVLLRKNLKFDTIAKIEVTAAAFSFMVAIGAGLLGHGVFALIWGQIAGTFVATSLLLVDGVKSWRPAFRFSPHDLKGYFSFGMYQMGERGLNYFGSKVDYLLIGRFLGADMLGFYMLAYELIVVPVKRINPILTRVAFPVFSQRQGDFSALRAGYTELTRLLAILIFPLLVVLGILAPVYVPVIFGPGWDLSIPLIQILAGIGILRAFGNPSGSMILALGRADLGFKWNLFTASLNSIVLFIAVQYGIYTMAGTYLILTMVYFILGQEILINRLIAITWLDYLSVFVFPMLISGIMAGVLFSAYASIDSLPIHAIASLILLVVLAMMIYLPGIWLTERSFITRVLGNIFSGKDSTSPIMEGD